jgi:hypothetical protein
MCTFERPFAISIVWASVDAATSRARAGAAADVNTVPFCVIVSPEART